MVDLLAGVRLEDRPVGILASCVSRAFGMMILGSVRPSDGLLVIRLRWDPCKKISWPLFYPMAFLILDDRETRVG